MKTLIIALILPLLLLAGSSLAEERQARTKQGSKSGQLSRSQSRKLQAQGRKTNRAAKWAKRDGKIARAKHNGRTKEGPAPERTQKALPSEEVDTSMNVAPVAGEKDELDFEE